MASTEKLELNGASIRPRDLLVKLLDRLPAGEANPPAEGLKAVVTEINGKIGARPVELRAETVGGPLAGQTAGPGKRLIAGPAAIVARALAAGRLRRPGVWAPEQAIDPEPFFAELAERGFTTRFSKKETVAAPVPAA